MFYPMDTYKRSQVEDSLWAVFRIGAAPQRVRPAFRSRIKKLLDLDRREQEGGVELPLVFNDARAEGQGQDVPFTSFHAFMLGLGLELWNSGLKQSTVIFFLRHSRETLEQQHARIIGARIAPYQVMAPIPGWPTRVLNDVTVADTSVYMLVDWIDFAETTGPDTAAGGGRLQPLIFVPRFCHGTAALVKTVGDLSPQRRTHLVVELSELAAMLDRHLKTTPARRRGRPT